MVYRLVVAPIQIKETKIDLNPQQQHYLLRVLRLKNGDLFIAMDGKGKAWKASIKGTEANLIEPITIDSELPISVNLVTALPKGSGYENIIRCCTELGATTFSPVMSDRTILKPSANKVQRWRKIATEAAEQSERQIVPAILEPISFAKKISQSETVKTKYICVARLDAPPLWNCLSENSAEEITIATGCEGGWTNSEIDRAIAVGYQPVTLGSRILRAITAPIVAMSLVVADSDR